MDLFTSALIFKFKLLFFIMSNFVFVMGRLLRIYLLELYNICFRGRAQQIFQIRLGGTEFTLKAEYFEIIDLVKL